MLLAVASCAKKQTVTGHFDGLEGDSLKVQVFDVINSRTPLQTFNIPVTDGDFAFDFADTTIRRITISTPDATGPSRTSFTYVPGERADRKSVV